MPAGKIEVTLHTCRISCQGCGRVACHPGPLAWVVTTRVMYADGKCPTCGGSDIFGEDLEEAVSFDPQPHSHAEVMAALATYGKAAV